MYRLVAVNMFTILSVFCSPYQIKLIFSVQWNYIFELNQQRQRKLPL